jgi:hypothetical protein
VDEDRLADTRQDDHAEGNRVDDAVIGFAPMAHHDQDRARDQGDER